ncbi:MAG: QueT transporter family protein [Clostridia bacterium]|nr:QueT transporter family protein [Clostridia bacterium]
MKKQKNNNATRYIVRGALIAAIYATLSYVSAPLQFLFFQFRISEALCILPIFIPEAVPGLFIGCIVANYLSGCVVWDILFGSLATLIGAIGARLLSKLPKKLMFLSTLPTVFSNAIIVPFVIMYAYGSSDSYMFLFITVLVGELVTATVMGTLLYYQMDKYNLNFNL